MIISKADCVCQAAPTIAIRAADPPVHPVLLRVNFFKSGGLPKKCRTDYKARTASAMISSMPASVRM